MSYVGRGKVREYISGGGNVRRGKCPEGKCPILLSRFLSGSRICST